MKIITLTLLGSLLASAASAQTYYAPPQPGAGQPYYPQAASAPQQYYAAPQPQQYATPQPQYAPQPQQTAYQQATQTYAVPQPMGEAQAYGQPQQRTAPYAMPSPVSQRPNWYTTVHGELSWVSDTDLKIGGAKVGDLEMDVEYAAGIALGYQPSEGQGFLSDMRFEVEMMYREVDFKNLANSTIAPGGFGGSEESYVGMFNSYYDFNTGTSITPYLGFGMGVAHQMFDSITIQTDDSDTVFAYQGMLGMAYTLNGYEYTKLGLGYRYFGTMDAEFENRTGTSVEHTYDGHNLEASLRIGF